ncbi:MAG: hypothetical protein ACOC7V_16375, partial [Spirochaetota bacterium]
MRDGVGLNRSSVAKLLVLALAALVAGGCGSPFRLVDLVDGPEGRALTVSPSSATITANTSVELLASGGYPPYSYSLDSGGGSLLENIYTAPDSSGDAEITVVDSVGASAQVGLAVVANVDYRVASAPAGGTYHPDSPAVESFTLENLGSEAGTADVAWVVYISSDPVLDADDPVFDNGSVAPLGASPASIDVSVEGVWPAVGGIYYLIVRVHSNDDIDPT